VSCTNLQAAIWTPWDLHCWRARKFVDCCAFTFVRVPLVDSPELLATLNIRTCASARPCCCEAWCVSVVHPQAVGRLLKCRSRGYTSPAPTLVQRCAADQGPLAHDSGVELATTLALPKVPTLYVQCGSAVTPGHCILKAVDTSIRRVLGLLNW
jgi:hypothetical protein